MENTIRTWKIVIRFKEKAEQKTISSSLNDN